ncbi:MAG: FRG domain-containing protein [Cupriavidus sp.]|uniref:FRG domain-containing protein n=1 Tax=Cupriavidus pauculus TaxID=82633 RepID=UPI000572953B|nr:FRG domain-containing protein [Cupriavidus pauculus]MBU67014.1 FRG domain-containing protein [Cupriavidus sp.]MBU69000.1 FRG domain-containing protein [Cupriavidus sp.]
MASSPFKQVSLDDLSLPTITHPAADLFEVKLDDWSQFHPAIARLESINQEIADTAVLGSTKWLFRGQADSEWPIVSALERFAPRIATLEEYYAHAFGPRYVIESETGEKWDIRPPHEFNDGLQQAASAPFVFSAQTDEYAYLVYLRHHGFPSPLVDWTRSPYVAAFFAYANAFHQSNERVAVFAYLEATGRGKATSPGSATIYSLGPYTRTAPRHYVQQAEYTVCLRRQGGDGHHAICGHTEAFARRESTQDVLIKFTVPRSEWRRALRYLDQHNMNAHTLYGSVDRLMETMAVREMLLSE